MKLAAAFLAVVSVLPVQFSREFYRVETNDYNCLIIYTEGHPKHKAPYLRVQAMAKRDRQPSEVKGFFYTGEGVWRDIIAQAGRAHYTNRADAVRESLPVLRSCLSEFMKEQKAQHR